MPLALLAVLSLAFGGPVDSTGLGGVATAARPAALPPSAQTVPLPVARPPALALAAASPAESPAQGDGAAAPPPSLDFDLMPKEAPSASQVAERAALEHALQTRRKVLQLHQGFGIATLALLAGTVVVGQLNYSNKFGGGDSGTYELTHGVLEAGATLTFATSGLLALFAPVPVRKEEHGISTVTVHKYSMLAATAGWAAEIVLGIITVSREGHLNQQSIAEAHLIVGYATTAAVATGFGALLFE